jgi:hypothetical protein
MDSYFTLVESSGHIIEEYVQSLFVLPNIIMKTSMLFTLQLAALASASPHFARQYETTNPHEWISAGSNDCKTYRTLCTLLIYMLI